MHQELLHRYSYLTFDGQVRKDFTLKTNRIWLSSLFKDNFVNGSMVEIKMRS